MTGQPTGAARADAYWDVIEVPETGNNAEVLARAGIRGPMHFLLRPDGHVALAATVLKSDVVRRYFEERIAN